jgi:hypothetical protein
MAKISKKRGTKSRAKTTHKKKAKTKKTRSPPRKRSEIQIDRALTDNFITLQKIMVNFSTRFDALSNQISKLLELFEISAKSLARRDLETDRENKDIKKVLEKLDNISQQAGLIGKGLALIHEISSEKELPMPAPQKPLMPPRKPAPRMQGYQRSIASRDSESKPSGSMTKEIPR